MKNDVIYSENELLPRIIKGDAKAFEQLFNEMHPALYFLARRLLGNEDLARDLVADIFLQVWETRETLHSIRNISAFLYTITRNRSIDRLKKVNRLTTLESARLKDELKENPVDNFLQAVYDAETIRILYQAIEKLPVECRKVVELGLEGCSTSEAAQRLGISLSAVSNQKSRAVKLLKQKLPLRLIPALLMLLD